jgi:hypothetical protein
VSATAERLRGPLLGVQHRAELTIVGLPRVGWRREVFGPIMPEICGTGGEQDPS